MERSDRGRIDGKTCIYSGMVLKDGAKEEEEGDNNLNNFLNYLPKTVRYLI